MLNLRGKTAIITGGGSGIGASIAYKFAHQGANVAILEIDLQKAQQFVADLDDDTLKISCYQVDISKHLDTIEVINKVIKHHGSVDILVNNAGVSQIGSLDQTSEQEFDKVFKVNVKGAYNCLYAVIDNMKTRKKGVILNMASVAAIVGLNDRFAYSATKGAIRSMTFSIAKDYLPYNIRCNCISPARVHTPFVDNFLSANYPGKEKEKYSELAATQPIGRMATPEEIANLALYLCADESSFITGNDYPIDGGFVTLNT
jgi:NAD(P)-dependent dehydrogenase (short-subunit alcohol dehydrogenase family)